MVYSCINTFFSLFYNASKILHLQTVLCSFRRGQWRSHVVQMLSGNNDNILFRLWPKFNLFYTVFLFYMIMGYTHRPNPNRLKVLKVKLFSCPYRITRRYWNHWLALKHLIFYKSNNTCALRKCHVRNDWNVNLLECGRLCEKALKQSHIIYSCIICNRTRDFYYIKMIINWVRSNVPDISSVL